MVFLIHLLICDQEVSISECVDTVILIIYEKIRTVTKVVIEVTMIRVEKLNHLDLEGVNTSNRCQSDKTRVKLYPQDIIHI